MGSEEGLKEPAEQAVLFPLQAAHSPPVPGALVSGTKLQCVFGWGRRLTKNETSVRDPWGSVGRNEFSGGTKEERVSSGRYRKDVFNLESNPKDFILTIFRKAIVCNGKSLGFGVKMSWDNLLTLLTTSCMILGKSLNPSEPYFSHWENGNNNKLNNVCKRSKINEFPIPPSGIIKK